jgi:plastocyanin
MRKASVLIVATGLAMFGLAACGGGDDNGDETSAAQTTTTQPAAGGGGAGGTVAISAPADGSLSFDQSSVSTKAGSVTINFDNPASLSHDVKVEDSSGNQLGGTDLVSQGTASATVDLQPGTYTFYCDVPGHREGGMEGTLTVN